MIPEITLLISVLVLGFFFTAFGFRMLVEDGRDWGWTSSDCIVGLITAVVGVCIMSVAITLLFTVF